MSEYFRRNEYFIPAGTDSNAEECPKKLTAEHENQEIIDEKLQEQLESKTRSKVILSFDEEPD
jgi:hypothetical protein